MSSEHILLKSISNQAQLKKIRANNFEINYLESGEGEPVLFIHGGNIGWGQWYPNIPYFATKYKVYAIDLPGGGRSQKIKYGKMHLERDLVKTVREFIKILHLEPISIIGSSIGGWIALKLALSKEIKIKKLVLADCIGFMDFMRTADRLLAIKPFAFLLSKTVLRPSKNNPNIEKFLRDVFYNKNTEIKKEFIDYFYETMKVAHNLMFISRLSSLKGVRKEFLFFDQLKEITSSTMIIWGEKDALMPLEKNIINFKKIPNVTIHIIKNAGHIPSIEQAQEFNRITSEFLLDK